VTQNNRKKRRTKKCAVKTSDSESGETSDSSVVEIIEPKPKIVRKPATFGEQLQHKRHNYSSYEGAVEALRNQPAGPTWKFIWKRRCKTCSIVTSGSLIILSSFSLLFIVPLIVDPILVGFAARFTQDPVSCRFVNVSKTFRRMLLLQI